MSGPWRASTRRETKGRDVSTDDQKDDDILWEGAPIPQFLWRPYDWLMLPFALVATYFLIVLAGMLPEVLRDSPGLGAVLVLIWLWVFYLPIGRFLVVRYMLKHFRYVIRKDRAQIFYKGELREEVDLHACRTISLQLYRPKRGRIVFGELDEPLPNFPLPFVVGAGSAPDFPLVGKWPPGPPRFENIPDAVGACRLLKKHFHVNVV